MTELTRSGPEMTTGGEAWRPTVKSLPFFLAYLATLFTFLFGGLLIEVLSGLIAVLFAAVFGAGLLLFLAIALLYATLKLCVEGSLRKLRRSA